MFTSFNVFKCGARADADVNAYLRYRFDQRRKPHFRVCVEIHAIRETSDFVRKDKRIKSNRQSHVKKIKSINTDPYYPNKSAIERNSINTCTKWNPFGHKSSYMFVPDQGIYEWNYSYVNASRDRDVMHVAQSNSKKCVRLYVQSRDDCTIG